MRLGAAPRLLGLGRRSPSALAPVGAVQELAWNHERKDTCAFRIVSMNGGADAPGRHLTRRRAGHTASDAPGLGTQYGTHYWR